MASIDDSTCKACQKPIASGPASLTQWIFGRQSCNCQSTVEVEVKHPVTACQNCGKEVRPQQVGTMTQWIFRPHYCACAASSPYKVPETSIEKAKTKSGELSDAGREKAPVEQELSIATESFPIKRYGPLLELGRGASGTVYLCRDRLLRTRVAVKILHALTGKHVLSFQQEARTSSRLDHPNIVKILDFGPTESGAPYMVMQYAPGATLQEYLEKTGPMNERTARHVFSQVCRALDHAHSRGIYHRDLKPSNIILVQGDSKNAMPEVKLIDFGVAKVIQETQEPTIIQGRTIAGTPAYMPPEMIAGEQYDARSELYSLGCVMFEMIAGKPPFRAERALAVMSKHTSETAPLPSEVTGYALPLFDPIIAKCLAKEREKRFQTASELLTVLESTDLEFAPPKAQGNATGGTRRTKVGLAVLALALAVLLGSSVIMLRQSRNRFEQSNEKENDEAADLEKVSKSDSQEFGQASAQLEKLEQVSSINIDLERAAGNGDADAQARLADAYSQGIAQDYAKALFWYSKAAEQGNRHAQTRLGRMYEVGLGTPRNLDKALSLYHKAALQQDATAEKHLASMYYSGIGVKRNYEEALKWYQKSALQGDAEAQNNLATMYIRGLGVRQNPEEALKWYRKSVEQGNAIAWNNLGTIYDTGKVLRRDYNEALNFYRKAAGKGSVEACVNLGSMYARGLGVPKSDELAIKWFRKGALREAALRRAGQYDRRFELYKADDPVTANAIRDVIDPDTKIGARYYAAELVDRNYRIAMSCFQRAASRGNARAELGIAIMNQEGEGIGKNPREAIAWYKKAAAHGNSVAKNNLALMYLNGEDVPKNYAKALELFRQAAKEGEAHAQVSLGYMYENGLGVKQNYAEAKECYRRAAAQALAAGEYNLGALYFYGLGEPKNYVEARKWFLKAAAQRDSRAHFKLGVLYQRGLGVKQNFAEAINWYRLMAADGNAEYQIGKMYQQGGFGISKDLDEATNWFVRAASHGSQEAKNEIKTVRLPP